MAENEYRYRIWIGPHHLHYDWSVIDLGASFSPVQTTTTGQVSGATTLVIASSTGFGSSGGVWVGPNGSGQGWEYEQYTARSGTTLTVVRESTDDREHNGVHSNAAFVAEWYELSTNDGQIQLSDDIDENLAAITWNATISGVLAPHSMLRNGHIIVMTESINGAAYTVALVGFVASCNITDNSAAMAEWVLNVVSAAQIVGEVDAEGVKVGETDLAKAGSATAVASLVLPFDERPSNDFSAASPDLSASAAIDDDLGTLWIAEHYTGADVWSAADNNDPENDYNLAFAHVYINPPTSAGTGARFIELRVRIDMTVEGYTLHAAGGGGSTLTWIFGGPGSMTAGQSIFLVEDEEAFGRINPLAESAAIYENSAFFQSLVATGGELWLRFGAINAWESRMRWGDGNGLINHEDMPDRTWTGAYVTAPATGETMRYIWTNTSGDAADYWDTSLVRHAGYNIDNDDPQWLMYSLPGLGLTLAQDMDNSSLDPIYLYGADEKYSTDGLPSSGTIVIGDEEITYSSKTDEYVQPTARGANGTTADEHLTGDEVYILYGSIYTDAFLVESVGWTRSRGTIYPKSFRMYTTAQMEDVRTPDQDDYTTDWTLQATVTANAASSYSLALSNTRVKHVLIEILEMTTDPARPRLNEVHAIMDTSLHDQSLYLATNTTAGALIQQMLENAGVPSGAISHASTPQVASTVTAADNAWSVIVDIAEYSGCRINVARDSKISVAPDTFWTTTPSIVTTWSRSNAADFQLSRRSAAPISQVILPWKAPSGESNGKIFYPTTAGRGRKMELPETLYNSSSAAQSAAQRMYYMRTYPYEGVIKASGTAITRRAGEYHSVTWQYPDPDVPAHNRNYVVLTADHRLTEGHWETTLRLMQYGHESNF